MYSPRFNFTETDASPLIDALVSDDISNVIDGADFSSLGLSTLFTFGTLTSCFLYPFITLFFAYLFRGSLDFVDVCLETGSDLTVIVNLLELKEVCDLEATFLLMLEQV